MAGKGPTLILLSLLAIAASKDANLRGGILFEQEQDRLVPINPKYSTYHRVINLDLPKKALNTASEYLTEYIEFCGRIANSLTDKHTKYACPASFFILTAKKPLTRANALCIDGYNNLLPEIRSQTDWEAMKNSAIDEDINTVVAGIKLDKTDATLKYISTNTPITNLFERYKYIDSDNVQQVIPINSSNALHYMHLYPTFVHEPLGDKGTLVAGQAHIMERHSKVICQFATGQQSNKLKTHTLQITSQACKMNIPRLTRLINKLKADVTLFEHHTEYRPHHKTHVIQNDDTHEYGTSNVCESTPTTRTQLMANLLITQSRKFTEDKVHLNIIQKYLQFELLSHYDSNVSFDDYMTHNDWPALVSSNNPFYNILLDVNCISPLYNVSQKDILNSKLNELFSSQHTYFINQAKTILNIPL